MLTFRQFLDEGINDAGIMKAIFIIGLPGAGKSYTIKQLKGTISPKIVNTDKAAEFLSSKWGKEIRSSNWEDFKDTAHRITGNMLLNYIDGMLPLFIDGTSNDVSNLLHRIGILESLGYDVGVIFVHASLDTAIRRAEERAKLMGRHVDIDFIKHVDKQNHENAAYLKSKISFFKEIKNDVDELDDAGMTEAFKRVQNFFSTPVENPIGKRTVDKMNADKLKYLSQGIVDRNVLMKKIEGWYKS